MTASGAAASPWTAAALALLPAAALLALAGRIHLRRVRAPRLTAAAGDPPAATVLLPVRDEEENVEECVRTLLAQTAAPRVVVVDDGSTDRTREIVASLVGAPARDPAEEGAAGEGRLALIASGELPPGWKGKVHALETGLAHVSTPWLLSTDADTRHAPELLARALATARARRLDSLSVAGRQVALGLGENLLTPVVFAALDGVLGDWRAAAEGETDVANGQFFLLRTDALRAIGGFGSLRSAPLDDVALARRLRAGGFRHGFLRAPDLLSVRMYQGFRGTFRGWRRNLGAFFVRRPGRAAAVAALLLGPPLLGAAAAAVGQGAAAAVLWAGGALASALLRRGSGHAPAHALLYPLDAVAVASCLLLGLRDASRGVLAPWKGRAVTLGE